MMMVMAMVMAVIVGYGVGDGLGLGDGDFFFFNSDGDEGCLGIVSGQQTCPLTFTERKKCFPMQRLWPV